MLWRKQDRIAGMAQGDSLMTNDVSRLLATGWCKKMIDPVRVTDNNFDTDLFWRASKTGYCSALSCGLAIATRLTHAQAWGVSGVHSVNLI